MKRTKIYLCSATLALISLQAQSASLFNPLQLAEAELLKIIDDEVLKMAPTEIEWTSGDGVQPKDAYEMDYSEKCNFIKESLNKKALSACIIVLSKDL